MFKVLISQENWILVYNHSDPEKIYNNFFIIFRSHYKSCFPLTTKYSNSNKPNMIGTHLASSSIAELHVNSTTHLFVVQLKYTKEIMLHTEIN